MATDPNLRRHLEWLGYLQPVGLTVTPGALLAAQALVDTSIHAEQQDFIRHLSEQGEKRVLGDLKACFRDVLRWEEGDLIADLSGKLDVLLPEYGETLSPSFAVPDPEDKSRWQMLIQVLPNGTDLDRGTTPNRDRWHASPQARFERLLWENQIPIGLLSNGEALRLVYAPRGESSGHLTFPVTAMAEVAGRPIFAAFYLLFSSDRLFTLPRNQRLPHILSESRRYQNEVSTELAEQVLGALYELLRGFREADWAVQGTLLRETLQKSPDDVYGGLLSTLMRLVFLLYAEERDLLSSNPTYVNHYSVSGLFARLRRDNERFPDTMDQRYGAWAQLLVLFRLMHDGAQHGPSFALPPRHGRLFDPDAYPFLEGRPFGSKRKPGAQLPSPKLSDGVVYRVLERLLILRGERISYRALDVEQVGSVYEAMMGFRLGIVNSRAIALRPDHIFVELDDILQATPGERAKLLKDLASCDVTGPALEKLKSARTHSQLVEALEKKISPRAREVLSEGSLYLQPTEERRRSGSHYTPRSLTAPIVGKTLEPIIRDLGPSPKPEQILNLKICDPAMGSGAFLVEVCRLLGKKLLTAWTTHKALPKLPPDEDEEKHAQRLIAQHCLYGVDKNPFAVDLAKLSLWLTTMARQHAFTFLDHALRHGDSLVGLSRDGIASFHWTPQKQMPLIRQHIDQAMKKAEDLRSQIRALATSDDTDEKATLLERVESSTELVRLIGDAAVSAFFNAIKEKERLTLLQNHSALVQVILDKRGEPTELRRISKALRESDKPIHPFHWEIEFPEVFDRQNGGFDAIVGNPPFLGGSRITRTLGASYLDYLLTSHEASHGNGDLVAHFFRRTFTFLRKSGAAGLIATKTIAQGDTRASGLKWICTAGGVIFSTQKRIRWPGSAAVLVSVVHFRKGVHPPPYSIDGKPVSNITAFLFEKGGNDDPFLLQANVKMGTFSGSKVNGKGFVIDRTLREQWIREDQKNARVIYPYLDGEDLNSDPHLQPQRFVICFEEWPAEEARNWREPFRHLENTTRIERAHNARPRVRDKWWQFEHYRPELYETVRSRNRVLACSAVSKWLSFVWCPTNIIFSHKLALFALKGDSAFAVLQSRVHEVFARFFSSTLEDRLNYSTSDSFLTFPFPTNYELSDPLSECGKQYYEFRSELMKKEGQGLTELYNRFHDPEDISPDVSKLRALQSSMDQSVLGSYGWNDILPKCDFFVDYEEGEDEGEARRNKPWRYRWIDEDRDEVLARLLTLNKQRADEEAIQASPPAASKKMGKGKKSQDDPHQPSLF